MAHDHSHSAPPASHSHSHSHSHGHSHAPPIDHAHSHDQGHAHSHGHGHSHGINPYHRECQAPTNAAVYCFIAAFVGSLSAVSLPTHITGYFLPSLPRTSLLWSVVSAGAVYGILCVVCFFGVLEEAVSEGYRAPVGLLGEEEDEGKEKKMGRLRWVNRAAAVAVGVEAGLSISLFALGLRFSAEEWNEWCSENALLVVIESSSDSRNAELLTMCEEMHLNQTYLVLAIPGLLLLLELARFLKTSQFVTLALDCPSDEELEDEKEEPQFHLLDEPDFGSEFDGGELEARARAVHELARRRRRGRDEKRRRRYRMAFSSESESSGEEEDEKRLLSR